jgi:hypothetical protein
VAGRRTELVKAEELESPVAVEIKNAQLIGLVNVARYGFEVATVSLPGQFNWNVIGDKFVNSFCIQFL